MYNNITLHTPATCYKNSLKNSNYFDHVGIPGKELADTLAKDAIKQPLITIENLNTKDKLKYIKNTLQAKTLSYITKTSAWYQSINQLQLNIYHITKNNHLSISRLDQINITRLRLGHTKITHTHYIDPNHTNPCPFYNDIVSIRHLLSTCNALNIQRQQIFKNTNPLEAQSNPTPPNI